MDPVVGAPHRPGRPASPVDAPERLTFTIRGMDCGSCAGTVERSVAALPGVREASVSFASATMAVTVVDDGNDGAEALPGRIVRAIERAGYVGAPVVAGRPRHLERPVPLWRDRRILPALAGALLWLAGYTLASRDITPIANLTFALAIVAAGRGVGRAAWGALRLRRLDMHVLMASAVVGAAVIGEWSEGAMVVILFTLGTTLQAVTIDRTRTTIRGLMDLSPDEATLLDGTTERVVLAAGLVPGDRIRVRPGERVAADGIIREGASSLDQRAISGESIPADRSAGDTVFAGTINGTGTLTVEVTVPASASTLTSIIHLVEDAQSSRAPVQSLVDRFAAVYTPVVLGLAALLMLGGTALTGDARGWSSSPAPAPW